MKIGNLRLRRLLICAMLALTVACQPQPNEQTAITNVTVIDAVSGVRSDRTVIFEHDRIVAITPAAEATVAARRIDGGGKFLIPGLWDMHVHLTYDPRLTDTMPTMFLRHGVTSVRDTGGLLENLLPVISEMRQDDAIAPRVFFSGPLMDGEHVVYNGGSVPEIGIQNSNVEIAAANVALLKESGADFIKIYEMVTPEVFTAIETAAREHNLPIAAHIPLSLSASTAGPRVDSLEHLRNIDLDCASNADDLLHSRIDILRNVDGLSGHKLRGNLHGLQRGPAMDAFDADRCNDVMATLRNVIQVPTARLNTLSLRPPWDRDDWTTAVQILPDDVAQVWLQVPTWFNADDNSYYEDVSGYQLNLIGFANAAGVPIGAGTDTPIARAIPGYSLHTELEVLVKAGLTPLEAIESATVRPAEFFGLESAMGAITVGMAADLVLLNANPLLDIRNTRDIDTVVFRGKLFNNPSQ